jgi:hypothetical protein
MPERLSYAVASALGSIAFYCWPRARKAMRGNYRRVLPGASRRERDRVARRSLVNYCKYLADFIRFPSIPAARLIEEVEGQSRFEALSRVLERGKGAVIVCMHFGNWDVGAGAAAARGYPLTVIAETFADPRLDGNYRLEADSPAIDAGAAIDAGPLDIDGEPRVQGAAIDIGADEAVVAGAAQIRVIRSIRRVRDAPERARY